MLELIGVYAKSANDMWFGVACDEKRIFSTSFAITQQKALKILLDAVPFNVHLQLFSEPTAFAEWVLGLVKDVYDGKGVSQVLPLATRHLSSYSRKVLKVTGLIPVGYIATYGAVSEAAGGSPRAVGNVMAANPFAPVVPCHRVVSAGFGLGGYGNLQVKREILSREKRGFISGRAIAVANRKLIVYPVEFVLRELDKTPP